MCLRAVDVRREDSKYRNLWDHYVDADVVVVISE